MTRHTKNSLAKVKHNTLSTLKTGYSITNSRKKTTKINTLLTEILETLKTWRKHLYNIVHHALCRICCNTWTKMVGCLEIAPANACRTEFFSFLLLLDIERCGIRGYLLPTYRSSISCDSCRWHATFIYKLFLSYNEFWLQSFVSSGDLLLCVFFCAVANQTNIPKTHNLTYKF